MSNEPAPERRPPSSSPLLIVISAPSGGGKTTLCQQLLARHPEMTRAITCTTRPPARRAKWMAATIIFLTATDFPAAWQAGAFLEHARVYDQSYGTPKAEVLDKLRHGRDVLLNIDVQGAATVCARAAADADLRHALVTVFLTPAAWRNLEARLRRRGADSPAQLEKRLSVARQEIAQWPHFQYLILSTTIAEDLRRMEAIIEAERMRCSRSKFTVKD